MTAALVEAELVGGECSYWACMPSKALLRPIEVLALAQAVPGVSVSGSLDVEAILARRDDFTSHLDDSSQVTWAEGVPIDVIRGHGALAGEKTVVVTAKDGTTRTLTARHAVVLGPGTVAAMPPIEGLADAHPWTSRDVTNLHEVPEPGAHHGRRRRGLRVGAVGQGTRRVVADHRGSGAAVTCQDGTVRLRTGREPVHRGWHHREDRGEGRRQSHGGRFRQPPSAIRAGARSPSPSTTAPPSSWTSWLSRSGARRSPTASGSRRWGCPRRGSSRSMTTWVSPTFPATGSTPSAMSTAGRC